MFPGPTPAQIWNLEFEQISKKKTSYLLQGVNIGACRYIGRFYTRDV